MLSAVKALGRPTGILTDMPGAYHLVGIHRPPG
jgi:hypothetical protein